MPLLAADAASRFDTSRQTRDIRRPPNIEAGRRGAGQPSSSAPACPPTTIFLDSRSRCARCDSRPPTSTRYDMPRGLMRRAIFYGRWAGRAPTSATLSQSISYWPVTFASAMLALILFIDAFTGALFFTDAAKRIASHFELRRHFSSDIAPLFSPRHASTEAFDDDLG